MAPKRTAGTRLRRAAALLLLGAMLGATAATLRLGGQLDRLTLDYAYLLDEVERLSGELTAREQALSRQRRAPVSAVRVEVANLSEEHARLHVEQRVHELLRGLVGEEVDALNATLIEAALSRRIAVENEDYAVRPTLIVLGREVYVRLEARPAQEAGRAGGEAARD